MSVVWMRRAGTVVVAGCAAALVDFRSLDEVAVTSRDRVAAVQADPGRPLPTTDASAAPLVPTAVGPISGPSTLTTLPR